MFHICRKVHVLPQEPSVPQFPHPCGGGTSRSVESTPLKAKSHLVTLGLEDPVGMPPLGVKCVMLFPRLIHGTFEKKKK